MNRYSFNANIQESLVSHWDFPALTDYSSDPLLFSDVAIQITKFHIFFEHCNIKRGDKIAICGKNSANWAISFFSILSYGAVAVPILNEFKVDAIHNLVNHSEAKILMVGDVVWEVLDESKMSNLHAIVQLQDLVLMACNDKTYQNAFENIEEDFKKKYPKGFSRQDISYVVDNYDELAVINYTSGTTTLSKGVMLSNRAINSNLQFAVDTMPFMQPGKNIISMLPMAHMYGLSFEIIFPFIAGVNIHFLTRVPSPCLAPNEKSGEENLSCPWSMKHGSSGQIPHPCHLNQNGLHDGIKSKNGNPLTGNAFLSSLGALDYGLNHFSHTFLASPNLNTGRIKVADTVVPED